MLTPLQVILSFSFSKSVHRFKVKVWEATNLKPNRKAGRLDSYHGTNKIILYLNTQFKAQTANRNFQGNGNTYLTRKQYCSSARQINMHFAAMLETSTFPNNREQLSKLIYCILKPILYYSHNYGGVSESLLSSVVLKEVHVSKNKYKYFLLSILREYFLY